MIAAPTTPPTTPPAIAPTSVWDLGLEDELADGPDPLEVALFDEFGYTYVSRGTVWDKTSARPELFQPYLGAFTLASPFGLWHH